MHAENPDQILGTFNLDIIKYVNNDRTVIENLYSRNILGVKKGIQLQLSIKVEKTCNNQRILQQNVYLRNQYFPISNK